MEKCSYCHQRKGKRSCPALGAAICAQCCGEHRGVALDCPDDCSYRVPKSGRDPLSDVLDKVSAFAIERHPGRIKAAQQAFSGGDAIAEWEVLGFLSHCIYHDRDRHGETLADLYRRERGAFSSGQEREALDALCESRFSLYEVLDAHPGRGLDIRDEAGGEALFVHEVSGSRDAVRHDRLLAWVVPLGASYLFDGAVNHVPLLHVPAVRDALLAGIEEARGRHPDGAEHEIRALAAPRAYAALRKALRGGAMPAVCNTDGDEIVPCEASWAISDAPRVCRVLESHPDMEPCVGAPGGCSFAWTGPGSPDSPLPGPVKLGTIDVGAGRLSLETNSLERRARGSALVEALLGPLVADRRDQLHPPGRMGGRVEDGSTSSWLEDLPEGERREAYDQINVQLMKRWMDSKIPALGGLTPREAARDLRRIPDLVELIEDQENLFTRSQPYPADLSWMFRALGIDRPEAPAPGPDPLDVPASDPLDVTRALIEELFSEPPRSLADLDRAAARLDRDRARIVLVDLLESCAQVNHRLLENLLHRIGPGHELGRLRELGRDLGRGDLVRSIALAVVDDADKDLFGSLDDGDRDLIAARIFLPLLDAALTEGTGIVTEVLLSNSGDIVQGLERARRYLDVPASFVYSHAALDPGTRPLMPVIANALALDGGFFASRLLDEALRVHPIDSVREARDRCVPTSGLFPTRVRMGGCDGQGAFVLVMTIDHPGGLVTAANMVLHAAGGVRDGFVMLQCTPADAEELIDSLERVGRLVDIPASYAAYLVEQAIERVPQVPSDAVAPSGYFGRILPELPSLPDAFSRIALNDVAPLLDSTAYHAGSWFFDRGDLGSVHLRDASDVPAAARALAPLANRVVAMARHMSLFHHLAGEPACAAIMAAAARDTGADFASSPLVHAMLLASLDRPQRPPGPDIDDAAIRAVIRDAHFSRVRSPRGRAMAELDFTLAALGLLSDAFERLPGEDRPTQANIERLALAVARVAVKYFMSTADLSGSALASLILRNVPAGVPDPQALADALIDYVLEVCAHCPVACMQNPRMGTAEAFNAPRHPMAR